MSFPNSERDAHDQLTAARGAAYAWLRATLAALPAAVTSLSVGCVLEDGDDRPNLAPRLRAEVVTPEVTLRYPEDYPDDDLECIDALDDGLAEMTRPFLFALGDEEWLTVTRAELDAAMKAAGIDPFVHMGRDPTPRVWISGKHGVALTLADADRRIADLSLERSVTLRVDRDPAPAVGFHDAQPISDADVRALAAITEEIARLWNGESITLRVERTKAGALTWKLDRP
jgi:hypothetical protein